MVTQPSVTKTSGKVSTPGQGERQITEEVWVCEVCVDASSAGRCHRAIGAAVTVVGDGSCYLQHRGEAGGITTVTTKKGFIING